MITENNHKTVSSRIYSDAAFMLGTAPCTEEITESFDSPFGDEPLVNVRRTPLIVPPEVCDQQSSTNQEPPAPTYDYRGLVEADAPSFLEDVAPDLPPVPPQRGIDAPPRQREKHDYTPNPARKHTRGRRGLKAHREELPPNEKARPRQLMNATKVVGENPKLKGRERERERIERSSRRNPVIRQLKGERARHDLTYATNVATNKGKEKGLIYGRKMRELRREGKYAADRERKAMPWDRKGKKKEEAVKAELKKKDALLDLSVFGDATLTALVVKQIDLVYKLRQGLLAHIPRKSPLEEQVKESLRAPDNMIFGMNFELDVIIKRNKRQFPPTSYRQLYEAAIELGKVESDIWDFITKDTKSMVQIRLLMEGLEWNPGPPVVFLLRSRGLISLLFSRAMTVHRPAVHWHTTPYHGPAGLEPDWLVVQSDQGVIGLFESLGTILVPSDFNITTLTWLLGTERPWLMGTLTMFSDQLREMHNSDPEYPQILGHRTRLMDYLDGWIDFLHTNGGVHALNGNSVPARIAAKHDTNPKPKKLNIQRPCPSMTSGDIKESVRAKAEATSRANRDTQVRKKRSNRFSAESKLVVDEANAASKKAGEMDADKEIVEAQKEDAKLPSVTKLESDISIEQEIHDMHVVNGEVIDVEGNVEEDGDQIIQEFYFLYGRESEQTFYGCAVSDLPPIPFTKRINAHGFVHATYHSTYTNAADTRDMYSRAVIRHKGTRTIICYTLEGGIEYLLGPREMLNDDEPLGIVEVDLDWLMYLARKQVASSGDYHLTLSTVIATNSRNMDYHVDSRYMASVQQTLLAHVYTSLLLLYNCSVHVPKFFDIMEDVGGRILETALLRATSKNLPLTPGRYVYGYGFTINETLSKYVDYKSRVLTAKVKVARLRANRVITNYFNQLEDRKAAYRARVAKIDFGLPLCMPKLTPFTMLAGAVKRLGPQYDALSTAVQERVLQVKDLLMGPKLGADPLPPVTFEVFREELDKHLAVSQYSEPDREAFASTAMYVFDAMSTGNSRSFSEAMARITNAKFKFFIKSEDYGVEQKKTPRFIVSPEIEYRAAGWALFHFAEHNIIVNSKLGEYLVKTVQVEDIPNKLAENLQDAGVMFENDYTSFESTITKWVIENIEKPYLTQFLKQSLGIYSHATHEIVEAYFDRLIYDVEIEGKNQRFFLSPMRLSGTYQTSIGNALLNAALTITATWDYLRQFKPHLTLKEHVSKLKLFIEGDDAIGLMPGEEGHPVGFAEWFEKHSPDYGAVAKAAIDTVFSGLSFCGTRGLEWGTAFLRIVNPIDVISRLGHILNPALDTDKNDAPLQTAKAMSYYHMYMHIPAIREACGIILERFSEIRIALLAEITEGEPITVAGRWLMKELREKKVNMGAFIQDNATLLTSIDLMRDNVVNAAIEHAFAFTHAQTMALIQELRRMRVTSEPIRPEFWAAYNSFRAVMDTAYNNVPDVRRLAGEAIHNARDSAVSRTLREAGPLVIHGAGIAALTLASVIVGSLVAPLILLMAMIMHTVLPLAFMGSAAAVLTITFLLFLGGAIFYTTAFFLTGCSLNRTKALAVSALWISVAVILFSLVTVWRQQIPAAWRRMLALIDAVVSVRPVAMVMGYILAMYRFARSWC